jgi:L-ribulose-5-phosphate 3-epimerase
LFAAVNAWSLPQDLPPTEQVAAAARAGFRGIELVLGEDGRLNFDTAVDEFCSLAEQAESLGLSITSLATGIFWRINYGAPERVERARAMDLTVRMLEALLSLRFEAEDRGVAIAIENVWNRFLLSPMEMVELIDRVNSPCVGAYLDVGNVLAYGFPEDWIELLGRRIARVHVKDYDVCRPGAAGFCPLGEGSIDWPGVIAALRTVGYAGPLTYEGPGELADIAARLKPILGLAVAGEEKA